jgi:DNA polymerase elongation subunit (family B)
LELSLWQFQGDLLHILFDCKDSVEVVTKGYEKALLLVTRTIDRIMTGEGVEQRDLVISKLLRQALTDYKSIFPQVAAAIQLSNEGKAPMKGQDIEYIYTNSKHKDPLHRVVALARQNDVTENIAYDKEKYVQLLLDAAETVLGYFGFDSTLYRNGQNKNNKRKWWAELEEERIKDVQAESNSAL